MIVELISVGTELLLGNIVNTNAAYLAEKCAALGLALYYQTSVGDNPKRLEETIQTALSRSDILILSGGLGPTKDDLTKETAAKVMQKELYLHEESKQRIIDFFAKRKIQPTENNWKQAMIPNGSIVVTNHNGTAPGVIMEENGKHIILMPGPPNEIVPMFEESIEPYLRNLEPGIILSKTVKICGIGESAVETMILDLMEEQTNPSIAPYAKTGEVHLRVTAKAINEIEAKKLIKPMVKELKNRFKEKIYTTDEAITLEQAVVDLLQTNQFSVTTAESCTGGLLAARLINVSGVSEVLNQGFITYSNKAKRKMLGVKRTTLNQFGAVSEEVAREMARGAAKVSKADVAVAITGIAGPEGGSKEKPVGLVFIACQVCGKTTVRRYCFSGNRAKVRETTVSAALTQMRQAMLCYFNDNILKKRN